MSGITVVPMLSPPSGYQWLIILLIVVLLFGAAKLPDLARGAGQALRIFRDETKNLGDGDEKKDTDTGTDTSSRRSSDSTDSPDNT